MSWQRYLPASRVYIVLLGAAAVACNSPASDDHRFSEAGPQAQGQAWLTAAVTLKDANTESSAARQAPQTTVGNFSLALYAVGGDEPVWSTIEEGIPLSNVSIQIPVGVQGTFYYSAEITTEDGRRYISADQMTDGAGQPLFSDVENQTISLIYGQTTDLHFDLYEDVELTGSVELNTDLTVALQLTDEQKGMVEALDGAQARVALTQCVAYGSSLAGIATYESETGRFHWQDLGNTFLMVGETCDIQVEIEEASAPRLKGHTTFTAPKGDGVFHIEMDLEVVDAYIDTFIDVQGALANITFSMDDALQGYLDQGQWNQALTYSLTADNGADQPMVTDLERYDDLIVGSLFPLNLEVPVYALTMTIWDGGDIVLQGSDVVDFSNNLDAHIALTYELGIEINGGNLTNVYFHSWLDDNADQVSDIHIDAAVVPVDGEPYTEGCDTGTQSNYTCLLRMPMGAVITPTYSYPGYVTEVGETFTIESLNSISLPYVRLYPEGCEHGTPDDPEVCDGFDNDCDGMADEGLAINGYYLDSDGDGFGDPTTGHEACSQPEGTVTNGDDCDDQSATSHPEATEVCDGGDNDCDEAIDEGLDQTFYTDADGDGYGDAGIEPQLACSQPDGTAQQGGDCDDADAGTNPGGTEICDTVDNNCDGSIDEGLTSTFFADADSDGYGDAAASIEACELPAGHVEDNTDCDDTQVAINPGATELCDGADNNCNTEVDEGLLNIYYVDADGDTYGDVNSPVEACELPTGHVEDATDCDDTSAQALPGGEEVCDGLDNDCNGEVDDGLDLTWHADADSDGFGDPANTIEACAQPAGYVEDATDCDDSRSDVHPEANETCDETDNDCDATVDEGATATYYPDADGDAHGNGAFPVEGCVAPEGHVDVAGDCDDSKADVNVDAPEICDNDDNDCDSLTDEGLLTTFFADTDADGHGDPATATDECEAPEGHVTLGDDCDDTDANAFTGNTETCDGTDNDCDGGVDEDLLITYYADVDGDGHGDGSTAVEVCEAPEGHVLTNDDCDDTDANAFTGNTEVCDGIDNNCDGATDEGTKISYYPDVDQDGYGSDSDVVEACETPEGYTGLNNDCEDADPAINPGVAEVCDGVDNNCDGNTDEGVTTTYHVDADEDGWGSDVDFVEACNLNVGRTETGGDCDDTDAGTNPDQVEVCDPQDADEDCDGAADGNDPEGAIGTYTWYLDGDDDGFGAEATTTQACENPTDETTSWSNKSTDCDDVDPEINPSVDEICGDGIDNNCDTHPCLKGDFDLSLANVQFIGEKKPDRAGYAVGSGDFNGDGLSDLLVASYRHNQNGGNSGSVYVIYGPVSNGDLDLSTADAEIIGEAIGDKAGQAAANAGDVNGDGYDDIIIGAPFQDAGGDDSGAAYLVYGPVSGEVYLSTADAKFVGENPGDRAGWSVSAAGDINGDGYGDVLVGATYNDEAANVAGAAYLLHGPLTGTIALASADAKIMGENPADALGFAVAPGGDINGDGNDDILVSANTNDEGGSNSGATYIFHGPVSGKFSASTGIKLIGASAEDYSGRSIAGGRDVNGDGYDDILVGTAYISEGTTATDAAYLVFGPVNASMSLNDADVIFTGDSSYQKNKMVVGFGGDLDHDGLDDILLGSYHESTGDYYGSTYVFMGVVEAGNIKVEKADARIIGEGISDYAGCAVSAAGDVNGDGNDDIIVGAWGNNDGGADAGSAYLILGGI